MMIGSDTVAPGVSFRHSITQTYRVNIEVPEELHQWTLAYGGNETAFDRAMAEAFAGNVAAGANLYSGHDEWADFRTFAEAEEARRLAVAVVTKYTQEALK